jgi:putative DNA primase/helicase
LALQKDINDEVIGRAAKRFALVWLALELAHGYGLLPFPIEQCEWAIRAVFDDWIAHRGGAGSFEIKQALERIEHEFVTNEFSDRILNLDERQDTLVRNLLAYQKDDLTDNLEFWVRMMLKRSRH